VNSKCINKMKIKTFTCHCSIPSKLLSQTKQPLTLVHTKPSPILNKTKIKTHKLTLHNNKKIFDLVIINNTTYNNKMTHSRYFTSMPTQPSIHLKKHSHTIWLYFSIFKIAMGEHSHYILCTHLHPLPLFIML